MSRYTRKATIAECPALPGCVSQGKDEKEALENIKDYINRRGGDLMIDVGSHDAIRKRVVRGQ